MEVENKIDNNMISKISKNPYSYAKDLSNEQLEEIIEYANDSYYNSEEVMTDEVYDILRDLLFQRNPKSKTLKKVGAPIIADKVKLPLWIVITDKIKPDTNALERWLKKYDGSYNVSDKLDGTSGMFHYFKSDKKWKTRFYTRGNGEYGKDISHLIPYLFPNIKENLPKEEICVRGEIVMSKQNFKKFNMKNSRSLTNGVVNSKKSIKPDLLNNIDFVVFNVLEPQCRKRKGLKYAKALGFKTVFNRNLKSLTNEFLSAELMKRREESEYEIDGIIVEQDKKHKRITSGNPKYGFAFKMVLSDQILESKILDVLWQPSKHGLLKPRILIESVIIGGITINYVTGHNAKFINDNKLGPGAIVQITLGGGIIPNILQTIKSAEPSFPDIPFHWNKNKVDIVLDNIDDNIQVTIRKIINFFAKIETKFLSKGLITRMVENGFNNIDDFINASQQDLLKFEGIKEKLALKLYTSIQSSIKNVPLHNLMDASNLFGLGFGRKKFKMIIDQIPNILEIDISEDELTEMIENIPGFKTTASKFSKKLPLFKHFMNEHPKITIQIQIKPSNKRKRSNSLNHINVLFTGVRDKSLSNYIIEHGGILSETFNKSVNVVITGDINSSSNKIKKAKKNNIPIMSLDNFKQNYIK
jgi:NAD-dependent DNA ligase